MIRLNTEALWIAAATPLSCLLVVLGSAPRRVGLSFGRGPAHEGEVSLLRKFLVWTATVMPLIGAPAASQAQDFDDQNEKWIPSVTFAVTVHDEDMDYVADNSINFDFSGNSSRTMASLRFGGELMSPVFEDLPAKPRFFGFAGVLWSTPGNGLGGDNHATESVEDYRDVNLGAAVRVFERQEFTTPGRAKTVEDFEGQGNTIRGRQLHNAWFLGVGSVFSFPMSGFTVRLRPSLEYVGEEVSTEGAFTLLTEPTDNVFIIHNGLLEDTEVHHSLGPGFELEFVNHLTSNVTLAFFTQTRFLWIVNDNKTTLRGRDGDGNPVTYSVERNRFNFRGGVGFRFGFRDFAFNFK
ncbi:MAG: hypothetical protein JRG89_15320 [Deltaproteobacteria bacterium]|nr:hypothetical protein [Deltaproteobacteria bacterium]MBW2389785.1 hypothetical protein [Deltaproteobacteria bacterium]MBW2723216.1 hypothetical protein [Deltaproteobacteria bacterium]